LFDCKLLVRDNAARDYFKIASLKGLRYGGAGEVLFFTSRT
jgi:hypothetical protein